MWEARHELATSAPPEVVWALWANADRWRDWNDDIEWARLDGPLERGATATIKFRRGRPMRFTVTALEPRRLFVDEARLPGARMGHEHRVEPTAAGARIANRIYIDGPAARLYALFVGRRIRASVVRFVERERELAEGES